MSRVVRPIIARARELTLVRAFLRYFEHQGPRLADSVTYRALFSVFAAVLLGFSLAALWLGGNPQAMSALTDALDTVIPGLTDLVDPSQINAPAGFTVVGVVSLAGLVGAAIGAIGSLRSALRIIADQNPGDGFFLWVLARNLLVAVALGVLLGVAAGLTVLGSLGVETIASWLGVSRSASVGVITRIIGILVVFVIDTLAIALVVRLLSGMKPAPRALWIGSMIGGAGLIVLQEFSGLFVRGATSNPLLASFATLVALLLWFNFSAQVILIAGSYIVVATEASSGHERESLNIPGAGSSVAAMNATHIGIVWNPSKAERAELERALAAAQDAAELSGAHVTWHETQQDDPGVQATREALDAGATVVLAVGGDGTVRAVAEHLGDSNADADLGIIPMGTGNLLARNLGLPLGDLTDAFTRALTGQTQAIDLGWAEIDEPNGAGRYAFAVMAGFGIDAHMITETDDDLKDRAGWLAYIESLGRAVSASEIIEVRVSANGSNAVSERAHTLIIGNCGALQGGITLLPDADPADGELDLLVLSAEGVTGWLDTMRNMVWDNGLKRLLTKHEAAESSDSTSHTRVTSLVLELEEPRAFEVDGDDLAETTRIEISVQPAAVRVRV